MKYDVDDLFLFSKIISYHRLNDAGKELGLTPSSITRFIQKLEGELGHPLIITTRNGFVPSYFGSALASRFGAYNELFNLELINALSLIKKYRASFNIYLTDMTANMVIKRLLKIPQEFYGVSFNFFQHSGEKFTQDFLDNAHFSLVVTHSQPIYDSYVAENSSFISSAYYELLCSEEYIRTYGTPSNLEQLQEHQSRIISSSNRAIYAFCSGDDKESFLLARQSAISCNGATLNHLIRTGHYIGVVVMQPTLHKGLIPLLPKYNFGSVSGYLFENKILTRKYPKELIEIVRKNILSALDELSNFIK